MNKYELIYIDDSIPALMIGNGNELEKGSMILRRCHVWDNDTHNYDCIVYPFSASPYFTLDHENSVIQHPIANGNGLIEWKPETVIESSGFKITVEDFIKILELWSKYCWWSLEINGKFIGVITDDNVYGKDFNTFLNIKSYGIRHADDDDLAMVSIEPLVIVNKWGTLLTSMCLDEQMEQERPGDPYIGLEPGKYESFEISYCDFIKWAVSNIVHDDRKVYKLFIAQQFTGLDPQELRIQREYIRQAYETYILKNSNYRVELIDTLDYVPEEDISNESSLSQRLYYLGHALQAMREADMVIFVGRWWESKGGRIEFMAALNYDIKTMNQFTFFNKCKIFSEKRDELQQHLFDIYEQLFVDGNGWEFCISEERRYIKKVIGTTDEPGVGVNISNRWDAKLTQLRLHSDIHSNYHLT